MKLTPFDGTVGTPNVHLTPNGSAVIVEAYQWTDSLGDQRTRTSTGDLVAYDVRTGTVLGKVKMPQAPAQPGRFMGFLEDGKTMFYASQDKVFTVDITSMTVSAAIDLPEGFEPIAAVSIK